LGAIFLTKSQAYVMAPVLGLAVILRWRRDEHDTRRLASQLAGVLGIGLLIGGVWWIRNLAVYGDLDWMGLARHNSVVAGQPTTAIWIATYGWEATAKRFLQFTFQSFWGMFGWMGVVLDARIYQALAVLSGVLVLGFGLHLSRRRVLWHRRQMSSAPWLLAFSAALTVAGYLWYNLTFVQHQGRYLFPALIPVSLAAGVGLLELARPRAARASASILISGGLICLLFGYLTLTAMCVGAGVLVQLNSALRTRGRWAFSAAVTLGLAGLSVVSLISFIVPTLS
jgi:hypothetical protein